jgi:acyl-CoA synthetase (AMP-forming)/AMP-acid ligase II
VSDANIAARLAARARAHGERPALVEFAGRRRRAVTYAELDARAAAFAARLARAGIGPGERVLVFVPVSIALYATLLGIFRRGAVAVFVDPGLGRTRIGDAVAATSPRAFAGTLRAHAYRLLSPALRAVPHAFVIRGDEAAPAPPAAPPAPLAPDAPALITFTTGSTGRPKSALRTHGFLWTQHEVLARHLAAGEGSVDLPTLPVFVLHDLAAGATAVLAGLDPRRPERVDPARVAAIVAAERVTTLLASPALAARLVAAAPLPLERLYTGGAPIDADLARRLADGVTGGVTLLYGSTEAEPIAAIDARAMIAAQAEPAAAGGGLCAGRPVPEIEVALIDPAARHLLRVAPGEAGEIAVAGAHVLPAYWNDPEADRAFKIADGARTWHRTGDGGRLDGEGRLWLLGRVRERIVRDGRTWWGLPVEQAALRLGGVRMAAYFAVEGEAVLALEGDRARHAEWTHERVREAVAPAPVDHVRRMTRISRDPRHHSKPDLERLRREFR